MDKPVLYGFDGSTYVRTVRMQFAEKRIDYEQIPVNVLEGEPRQPEHLARHPFGKVPVLGHDGMQILETTAIVRYVEDVFDGKSLVPADVKDRARMNMAMGLIDAYGYGALAGKVAAFHIFPDLFDNPSDEDRREGIRQGMLLLNFLMERRGTDAYLAGTELSLADLYLAPICAYVEQTPDADQVFSVAGFANWWDRMSTLESFVGTAP